MVLDRSAILVLKGGSRLLGIENCSSSRRCSMPIQGTVSFESSFRPFYNFQSRTRMLLPSPCMGLSKVYLGRDALTPSRKHRTGVHLEKDRSQFLQLLCVASAVKDLSVLVGSRET
jgi:hypothetical protein